MKYICHIHNNYIHNIHDNIHNIYIVDCIQCVYYILVEIRWKSANPAIRLSWFRRQWAVSGISFRIINCSSFCSFCYCCYCCCCCRRRRSLSVRSIQLLTEEAPPTHPLSSCFPLPSLHSHFAHAAASDGLHKKERHKEKKQAEWEKEEEGRRPWRISGKVEATEMTTTKTAAVWTPIRRTMTDGDSSGWDGAESEIKRRYTWDTTERIQWNQWTESGKMKDSEGS